jgi:FMN reductase
MSLPLLRRPVRLAVVVGNPNAGSRTLGVATAVADALVSLDAPAERTVVDLADIAGDLFDPESATVQGLLEEVAASDIVIAASPTYKATYTGLLKAFFDRYGNNGLSSTVAIPVMTGAAGIHALAPEVFLRPLLVELGASVPTRGLFVTEAEFSSLDDIVARWAVTARPTILGPR